MKIKQLPPCLIFHLKRFKYMKHLNRWAARSCWLRWPWARLGPWGISGMTHCFGARCKQQSAIAFRALPHPCPSRPCQSRRPSALPHPLVPAPPGSASCRTGWFSPSSSSSATPWRARRARTRPTRCSRSSCTLAATCTMVSGRGRARAARRGGAGLWPLQRPLGWARGRRALCARWQLQLTSCARSQCPGAASPAPPSPAAGGRQLRGSAGMWTLPAPPAPPVPPLALLCLNSLPAGPSPLPCLAPPFQATTCR
jgi:hypothetical protein